MKGLPFTRNLGCLKFSKIAKKFRSLSNLDHTILLFGYLVNFHWIVWFDTFPGGCRGYVAGGCRGYVVGGCRGYVTTGTVIIELTQSSWAGAGTEFGNTKWIFYTKIFQRHAW